MTVIPEKKISSIITSARIILLTTALSQIYFMYSIKESENKDAICIFCNEKFSEGKQGEIWIKCFIYVVPVQRTQSISMTFINSLEADMVIV